MSRVTASSGLILEEPLLWEKGKKGRRGFSPPERDVGSHPLAEELTGDPPDIPELSEVDVVRHYTRLSQWNFGLDTGMYPLGSCTMKYNPKTNERQASLSGFTGAHPLLPESLCQGLLKIISETEHYLSEITGMDETTIQPSAGAHGELTGMLLIHAFHEHHEARKSKIIVPDTAHGTNPASAALCGYTPVPLRSNEHGIMDPEAVEAMMDEDVAGIMVTNPNTLGLFEEHLHRIADIVHAKGGLVYCDGANMNAVMGIVKMGDLGVDVMHLNLHKTFSTPHGGGGPGSGPVAVKKHLAPFLPVPRVVMGDDGAFELSSNFPLSIGRVLAFHGSIGVAIKAYSYIRSMGPDLAQASRLAVLNANYLKERLKEDLHLAYDRPCMHECVFSDAFQKEYGVSTLDIAKRLIDYGFHPPTVYFPLVVPGAVMVEPTETESIENLDQFVDALQSIAKEARENPDVLRSAPSLSKLRRLDEVAAARKPCLAG
ncbi:MAG TPA: glycine dehydrogenase subunit 2 [Desulfobacteraceae bacterium]|nr:glycine dehydrogenase subunit 2 [Desulfobacteraceae bacterium]